MISFILGTKKKVFNKIMLDLVLNYNLVMIEIKLENIFFM